MQINKNLNQTSLKKKLLSNDMITIYVVALFYAVYSALIYSGSAGRQMLNLSITLSCYVLMAISLNLVVGFLGELSLGHAAFMSVGAYAGSMFSMFLLEKAPDMQLWLRLPLSMVVGGIFAAIFGILIGIPVLRLNGDYLAIVTLAFGEIVKNVIENLDFLGRAIGLDTSSIYSKPQTLIPYAAFAVLIAVILVINLTKSKHGRAITAIRDNKIAASATGVNVTYYKLMVFALSAFIAGVAGTLWGHNLAIVKAAKFDFNMSIEILVIVVLGGMGNVRGSILAAILLQILPEALRGIEEYRMLIYSLLLILMMLFNSSPVLKPLKDKLNVKNIIKNIKQKKAKKEE